MQLRKIHKRKSILEQINKVIATLIYTFDLKNNYPDKNCPWSGILADTNFVVKSTYYTMLQATPGQMLFGSYMVLNNPFISDWGYTRKHNQQLIDINNQIKHKIANRINKIVINMRSHKNTPT